MLIVNNKSFIKGIILFITFLVVLFIMFTPIFKGSNAFKASDDLFNSIAKGSSYYIDKLKKESKDFLKVNVSVKIDFKENKIAKQAYLLLTNANTQVKNIGSKIEVHGSLGSIFIKALDDADAMFFNKNQELTAKYHLDGKDVLFTWWWIFKEMGKELKEQKHFKEAAFTEHVSMKGVEVGYNFFKIEPKNALANAGVLAGTLIFYIIYTLWWGFAILLLFDGFGLEMKKSVKKEM